VAALSSNDLKLLALAHTLEVAAHGSQHLHAHPSQVSTSGSTSGWAMWAMWACPCHRCCLATFRCPSPLL